jgi:uncharacterized phage protein (TIGR01671 family)
MREIKFRAWQKNDSEYRLETEPEYYMDYDPTFKVDVIGAGATEEYAELNEGLKSISNLMQYTGIKDYNGKEIYEGDIVHNVTYTFNGVVFFDNGSFWVREYLSHVDEGLYDDREKETRWSIDLSWEIIGNIYENPDLLEIAEPGL